MTWSSSKPPRSVLVSSSVKVMMGYCCFPHSCPHPSSSHLSQLLPPDLTAFSSTLEFCVNLQLLFLESSPKTSDHMWDKLNIVQIGSVANFLMHRQQKPRAGLGK